MKLDDGTSADDGWRRAQAGFRLDLNEQSGVATPAGRHVHGIQRQGLVRAARASAAPICSAAGRQVATIRNSRSRVISIMCCGMRLQRARASRWKPSIWKHSRARRWACGTNWCGAQVDGLYRYHVNNTAVLLFLPAERDLQLWNAFAQDTVSLSPTLKLTLGVKFEHNTYSKWEPQPDIRLAWQTSDTTMVWASAARAIRAPTPLRRMWSSAWTARISSLAIRSSGPRP